MFTSLSTVSLLDNRWPVTAVISDDKVTKKQYRYLDLSSENWMLLEELIMVLEPLEIATVFLSKEQNVSLSVVFPVIQGLVSRLEVTEEGSQLIRHFKITVAAAMKRQWSLDSLDVCQVSFFVSYSTGSKISCFEVFE